MANGAVMEIVSVPQAIEWQAQHAEQNGAPGTARIVRALLALESSTAATARRIHGWQGLSLRDAMPLRIAGGIHNLLLTGEEPRLETVYSGLMSDQAQVDTLVRELVETHDARLMPWLDGPPQTNEVGRSASIMAGLLWLADGRALPNFELLEIGASAGINTMMGRYRYDLGGAVAGPADSPMRIEPEWRGPPPTTCEISIVDARGNDIAPVDLSDRDQALRLKSYVWPEASQRMARIDTAIALAEQSPPQIARGDAGDWVCEQLAQPQKPGVTRVLFHSVMWQYLPDETQARIEDAMDAAGEQADDQRPLAWIALETNRETFAHELRVRHWPGGQEAVHLSTAHPHGAWVEWLA
jgi:hypothetical protein